MKSEALRGEELLMLQNEKGNICVSIIIPTHRLSPDRQVDEQETATAFSHAKEILSFKYPEDKIQPIIQRMDEMLESLEYTHNHEGLAFFFSPNITLQKKLSFRVEKKIIVGDSFELRDILYELNYAIKYYTLLLSENEVRLYEGNWTTLTEIKSENHFPKYYNEEFTYNPPSRSSSLGGQAHVKDFEKDKSILEEIRIKDFFRAINKILGSFITAQAPIIITGPKKELQWYTSVSTHKQIIGKIEGNYTHSSLQQLALKAWTLVYKHLQDERTSLINEFKENFGTHRSVSGIQEVWQVVQEGNILKLLIEKDYHCPAFIGADNYHFYLRPPSTPHKIVTDAVDELIENALAKNGKIYFVDDDTLKEYGRIALITRY
ncbi:MAG: hypothetical protein KGO81_09170 [Bacteroidota bacterium]|nr:hypothetical protein [Bacteroidota bacterium]